MRDMLGINVEQQTYLSRYFLSEHLVPAERGRLCIVSSIVAYSLGSANSLYFSAKSYLSQFGRSLAHECRTLGCGVLTIQPGAMADTNFSSAGDCENSAIFKLPGAQMSSADVAEELVRRLQADDASEATGCHTVGILNKILVAGGPYLSDNLAGFVARFVLLGPDTKFVRSFTARESKLVDRCR
ncbi:hypothetical protein FOZ62_028819 [Perkinsus olseni]|uniref:Uncharacterized protein n=1 Tax=Perkinsus olseni TaxID=32597 RepID=A0A7J6TEQ8_PEROL|nr:hypothetical protein FOZ62_028819 [Perkinsus olseni]